MNSCLYKARVMHNRLSPQPHHFDYKVFLFCLDLAELDQLSKKLRLLSRNRFNLFNFRDSDHLQLPGTQGEIRSHLTQWLQTHNIELGNGRVMLLTNCRTLGHQFNPVSFYFCFNEEDQPLCAVAEVGNTFHEMKPYLLGRSSLQDNPFHEKIRKYFYVSPFIDMDTWFDFDLKIPDQNLKIRIDDYDAEGHRFFV